MTEQEILVRANELREWMGESRDAKMAVKGVCLSYGCSTVGELAALDNEAFEMLHESIKDMMEQIPSYWTP